jgi:NADH-quinone oxidoreductase subunit M
MLACTIYLSFAGAVTCFLIPPTRATLLRLVALITAVAGFTLALIPFLHHPTGLLQTITDAPWIPTLGIRYHLAADGISLAMVLLTGVIAISGVLFSWNITHRLNQFFALYLLLIAAVYGVFLSYDLFLLFVFYEIVVIPKYFLIAIWGSTRKEYAAMKLVLYSFGSSALVLIGLIAAYVAAGSHTMSLEALAAHPFTPHFQMLAFPLVFLGFAILAGIFPFHTWAPTGHVAAPTAASMLLAGVVMKLGAYGCLRVAMTLFPLGLAPWGFHLLGIGSWRTVFALLATIGIVYGALSALVQKDFKFVIGYSSVSHMGFILLGLMTLTHIGLTGAMVQMVSHGILAGLLFAVVGRMVYARTHTRDLDKLGPMNLSKLLPFAAVTFTLAGMASMGLPGFSGFIAESMIVVGVWRSYPALVFCVGFGILLGVVYIWRALQQAFFAKSLTSAATPAHHPPHQIASITLPEKLGAALLILASIAVGLYPQFLLNVIAPALNSSLFHGLHTGGW